MAEHHFSGSPAAARTAAVMRSTARQLRRTAVRMYSGAAAARSGRTAGRLRVLGDAVLAQADAIDQRAARLAAVDTETPPSFEGGERPLP